MAFPSATDFTSTCTILVTNKWCVHLSGKCYACMWDCVLGKAAGWEQECHSVSKQVSVLRPLSSRRLRARAKTAQISCQYLQVALPSVSLSLMIVAQVQALVLFAVHSTRPPIWNYKAPGWLHISVHVVKPFECDLFSIWKRKWMSESLHVSRPADLHVNLVTSHNTRHGWKPSYSRNVKLSNVLGW